MKPRRRRLWECRAGVCKKAAGLGGAGRKASPKARYRALMDGDASPSCEELGDLYESLVRSHSRKQRPGGFKNTNELSMAGQVALRFRRRGCSRVPRGPRRRTRR